MLWRFFFGKKGKDFKKGLITVPSVKKFDLRLCHKWLILASDGLWDVLKTYEEL